MGEVDRGLGFRADRGPKGAVKGCWGAVGGRGRLTEGVTYCLFTGLSLSKPF